MRSAAKTDWLEMVVYSPEQIEWLLSNPALGTQATFEDSH